MSKVSVEMEGKEGQSQGNGSSYGLQIYISWKDLTFIVNNEDPKTRKEQPNRTILNKLNGHVKPGELLAVIGPSGSGKSSFLNCMAGRNLVGVTGDILCNGVPRPSNFARFTGYVIQDDLYFESLTVLETLRFTANLKLPTTMTKAEKEKRIQDIIEELDLGKCSNTVIGTVGNGISGGERRRLAIALEIINEPRLLLLDEPTSGLDSASALLVGKILKKLSTKKNITIIATIHQPRYQLTTLFDKIYLLAKGNELYFGPTFPDCLTYFANIGYKCPEYDNPADFLLDLVNTSIEDDVISNNDFQFGMRDEIIDELSKKYLMSNLHANALNVNIPSEHDGHKIFDKIASDFYITSFVNQVYVLFKRTFLHKLREPIATMTQIFNAIFMPVVFGSVYWDIDLSQQSAYDRISAISLAALMLAFMAFDILMLFPTERSIFNREQAAGMYRPISFYLGRTLSEMPQHSLLAAIFGAIAYWMYGLQNDADKFLKWELVLIIETNCGAGLLILFSALSKNIEQSNLLATLFLLLFMLFDANWIALDKIPVYWRWLTEISFLGYASQALMVTEYQGLTFECTQQEIDTSECLFQTGEQVLYSRGLDGVDFWRNVWILILLTVVYRVLAYIAFWLLFRNHSPSVIIKNTFPCLKKNN